MKCVLLLIVLSGWVIFFPPLSFFSLNILAVCRFFIICMEKMFLFGWLIFKMLKEEFSDIFNIKN